MEINTLINQHKSRFDKFYINLLNKIKKKSDIINYKSITVLSDVEKKIIKLSKDI